MKKYSNELKNLFLDIKIKRPSSKCREGSPLGDLLRKETSFLVGNPRLSVRLWYVQNDIFEQVKCLNCETCTDINITKNGAKIRFCSLKCRSEYKDESGLTIQQKNGIKQSLTKKKINKTGLSISQEGAIKASKTMRIKDTQGLSIYEKSSAKQRKTKAIINNNTGLTKAQEIGLKAKNTLSKIDPKTGLTGFQEIGLKTSKTLLNNPEISKSRVKKREKVLSKIDPKTGLTGFQEIGLKVSEVLNTLNSETGLTKAQEIGLKSKNTLSKIDPKTGLTGFQEIGLKSKNTLSKIDPKTGLTGYQVNGLKIKETLNTLNSETGLTKAQELVLKSSETNKRKYYKFLVKSFPVDYELLTTENEYISDTEYKFKYKHLKCGNIGFKVGQEDIRCIKCYPYNRSIAEKEVFEFCQSLTDNVVSNTRKIINPKELDIYLPEYNLAIEYDGLYYHSTDCIENERSDYHLRKTQMCLNNNIQLFHIFENEWNDIVKQDIWKSIIANKIDKSNKIYARKCEIKHVSSKESKEFLIDNHLQGSVNSSIRIGLYYNNELVSIMTFGKSRYNKKVDWELVRYCNKKYNSVIGGASKLFKYFKRSHNGIIISYADMRKSNGNLYKQLGFKLDHISKPNYWYYCHNRTGLLLESRLKYQKHKLKNILGNFDPCLTASENMYNNGFRKIYDCGNQVWIYG